MIRPREKTGYDAAKIMKELLAAVSESYEETGELKQTAEEFSMPALKIRKLLITARVYSNDISDEVNNRKRLISLRMDKIKQFPRNR